jgi:hypothetical protein
MLRGFICACAQQRDCGNSNYIFSTGHFGATETHVEITLYFNKVVLLIFQVCLNVGVALHACFAIGNDNQLPDASLRWHDKGTE